MSTEIQTINNQPNFSINPDTKLVSGQGMSRRVFLRLCGLAAGAALLAACGVKPSGETGEQGEVQSVTPVISPELSEALGENGVASIERAFSSYIGEYGCPIPTISFNVADLSGQTTVNPDGSRVIVLEQAGPGYVNYDVEALTNGKSDSEASKAIRDTTIHSLTHACQPEATQLSNPVVLGDGSQVNALQGMSLLVTRPDGTQTGFRAIEEGVCEALAVKLNPDYTVSDFSYFQLGSLTISIMNTWSSAQDVARMAQSNDVFGYVGIVRGKSKPTQQDLEQVMTWYQRARNGEDLQTIQNEIVQSRGR